MKLKGAVLSQGLDVSPSAQAPLELNGILSYCTLLIRAGCQRFAARSFKLAAFLRLQAAQSLNPLFNPCSSLFSLGGMLNALELLSCEESFLQK